MASPPTRPSVSGHPRRTPANRSVSLMHSPRPRLADFKNHSSSSGEGGLLYRPRPNPDQNAPTDSPASLHHNGGVNSSGESSNAEKWFEKSNNNVREESAAFADNASPFFLRRSSSSETPPGGLRRSMHALETVEYQPQYTGLLELGADASSADDFRGVIDDLTVENKKLKRRLKKYEKLHDAHLKDEKLFEVRVHGLPPEKKRELEEMLRRFASGLGTTGSSVFPPNGYASLLPTLNTLKATSSQTSFQNADSAYASMSASGQGSSAQSGFDSKQKVTPTNYMAARRQNIHSYLHDIPEGLLPQENPTTMTERSKKKVIVRKLEQVFAGKGAALRENQQPLQQQEVSQSAAKANRSAVKASGQRARKEGTREAPIMDHETEDPMDLEHDNAKQSWEEMTKQQPQDSFHQPHLEEQSSKPTNTEQRPTRPLDLDPQRAQVPDDNIRYMRHLGFSPPYPESSKTPEEGHGWIYLNFLVNMAQLHTINVTTDLVRNALGEYSNKLEVSSDGRKVRWKGGSSISRMSSSGASSPNDDNSTPHGESPRKRPKLSHMRSTSSHTTGVIGGASQRLRSESGKHVYAPLFSHRGGVDDADASSPEQGRPASPPPFPVHVAGNSSGMTSSGVRASSDLRTSSSHQQKQNNDDGPIIFYNNAGFCTDLSGDRRVDGNQNPPCYTRASALPIGKPQTAAIAASEKRGPLAKGFRLPEPMDLGDNPIPESLEISFPTRSPLQSARPVEQKPINLEVTGIGGVWPADNFAISVESRHARIEQQEALGVPGDIAPKSLPHRLAKVLHGAHPRPETRPAIYKQVVASKIQDLPPSELPPALSFMPFDEDSMSDESSHMDDSMTGTPGSPGASAAPQPVDMPYAYSDDEGEDDEDCDSESDGEVDFLAAAREVDPEAVRQREREYDANMAERLVEEIPAGSSAATAGGGTSGFVSPAKGVGRKEYRSAMRESRVKPADLRRAVSGDSMAVQGIEDSSNSDEEMSDVGS